MLNTIFNHRSIRNYKTDPVPAPILTEILAAGTRASTTGNMQVYSIVVTRDSSLKEKLWEAHFRQNMVKIAPVVLTFCADFNRFNTWCRLRQAEPGTDNFLSFFTAAIDALLVSQNCALAAEAHGLGICYLGTTTYQAEWIADILHLPSGVVPVTTLVTGYAADNPPLTDRLPLEAVVHDEIYRECGETEIDTWYAEKEASPLTARLLEENQLDTLAQIFTQKRYPRKDNEAFSEKFLSAIKSQGFQFPG